ncbi:mycothiol synthase [Corynebacterium testudinoris]|uniref:Mycothiol acetyltransferase n=1 Tax=Corynebacterium testudinoris TaxID=136857 RepID=A0A0G3HCK7_9CORY|nr:mycothiol synthase [Corynebacterium testudinoris]AKK09643.1 mycothiol synthase [Corynebacterium testudinoris]MBX8996351.1 mycothiol synthase [Corynebacterium testudinoris]
MFIETLSLPDHPELAARVRDIATRAAAVDGVDPLSEQFLLGLIDARLGHRHHLARDGEHVLGVAAFDGSAYELVVDPDRRRAGVGAALLTSAGESDVWAHGDLPAARALAAAVDRVPTRRLLVMAVEGDALSSVASYHERDDVHPLNLAESIATWGRDAVEEKWLAANNEAFSWHPEQGGWDRSRLSRAQEADWFSPDDVLFLWTPEGKMAGFHWTKWHTEVSPAFGEVYVVGLASAFRGRGMGDPLLRVGLEHLAGKGANRVVLYVEADNEAAVKAYDHLGFNVVEEHVVYSVAHSG